MFFCLVLALHLFLLLQGEHSPDLFWRDLLVCLGGDALLLVVVVMFSPLQLETDADLLHQLLPVCSASSYLF